ncbi:GNAT family N-acetyltransferase [Novosphingobium sp. THN1]|uniref:GNAT family N-acetyltransferase n=1 Tax=Novosphingobium sp. THN1 TaxID=1016987 RepID=UPI00351167D7
MALWPRRRQAFRRGSAGGNHPHFLATLPGAHGSRLIGCVGLIEESGETELGYWVAQAHWGRGFATEAVRSVLSLARTLGHHRVNARHFADNPASARVLEKAGFRPTGEIRLGHSPARTQPAPTVHHVIDLVAPVDCDGPEDGGFEPMRRAA